MGHRVSRCGFTEIAMKALTKKERTRASQRKYYLKNKAKLNLKSTKWSKANKKRTAEISRKSKQKNGIKYIPVSRSWDRSNPERVKRYARESFRRRCDVMSDAYVKDVIANRSTLKSEDVPRSLMQAKRAELKLLRLIKEQ